MEAGAGIVAFLLVFIGWLGLRDTTPVGYFTSAEGRDRFVAAYDRAMAELPRPAATLDVRTTHGIVRVYRFEGAAPGRAPLVLAPGRAAASPLWADNLSHFLRLRTVHTLDLLGEPGMSVQARQLDSRRRTGRQSPDRQLTCTEQARRAQLSDVTIRLIAEHGYAGCSLQRIAEAAGITEAAVIYHFTGKRAVIRAAYDTVIAGLADQVGARIAEATTPAGQFDAHVRRPRHPRTPVRSPPE